MEYVLTTYYGVVCVSLENSTMISSDSDRVVINNYQKVRSTYILRTPSQVLSPGTGGLQPRDPRGQCVGLS